MAYIGYILILIFVSIIAWLSNKEINRSLEQARKSEEFLTNERNSLERLIHKRTKELIESEKIRDIELERNAKFGELSQGLFHDLMNPLSSLALFIENIAKKDKYSDEMKSMVNKAVIASRRMESFMNSIRHVTSKAEKTEILKADLTEELKTVNDLLSYKARMKGIKIIIDKFGVITLEINPFRLHQLLLNLISNSLEACISRFENSNQDNTEGFIKIKALKDKDNVKITIEDNGCGIPKDKIKDIFVSPFTTKPKGTGIGLITIKKIIDEELHGTISISNKENGGAICTIVIPAKK
jgi:signal transduction histidine kinase